MSPRLAPPPAAIAAERLSARVERVCAILDCVPRQVYRLIEAGELEAHGIGLRGVRVYLDSVDAYRQRQEIVPKNRKGINRRVHLKPPDPSAASKKAHLAAVASLRKDGLL